MDLKTTTVAAQLMAQATLAPLAAIFCRERLKQLESERINLDAWLADRAAQIATPQAAHAQEGTADLFGSPRSALPAATTWLAEPDPFRRLAGLASDGHVRGTLRREADVACGVWKRRHNDLIDRLDLRAPEVQLIGLLLLVPEDNRGS